MSRSILRRRKDKARRLRNIFYLQHVERAVPIIPYGSAGLTLWRRRFIREHIRRSLRRKRSMKASGAYYP